MAFLYSDVLCMLCKAELGRRPAAKPVKAHCKTCGIMWSFEGNQDTPYHFRKDENISDIQVPRNYSWDDTWYWENGKPKKKEEPPQD